MSKWIPGVIAVDPGVATGVAWWSQRTGFVKVEVGGGLPAFARFWDYSYPVAAAYVVCESWDYNRSSGKSVPTASTDIIGMLKYIETCSGWTLHMQRPADRIVIPDEDLKAVGLWLPAWAGHGRDAARHLLRFMRSNREYHPILEEYGL